MKHRELPLFDAVIMNPPFEKGQDAVHVRHAYRLLKEGGRLCAVMSAGTFFRSDRNAREFREWLEEVGGTVEDLPEGSFKGTGEIIQTGTSTKLVTIER